MKRISTPSIAFFLVVAFFNCIGCRGASHEAPEVETHPEEHSEHGGVVHLDDEALANINLEVTEVAYKKIDNHISAPARIFPDQNREAHVGPLIEGRANTIFANQGDRVKAGDVLMLLESPEVGEAKSEYFKAKAELEFAERDYERHKRLFEEKIGSQKALLESEASYNKARAEFEAADKKLHAIGFTTDEIENFQSNHERTAILPLRAPISGTVVERNATVGQLIEPSSDVFHIIDLFSLWVDADVYEKDICKVRPGQEVEIRVAAYPDETFTGQVTYISDVLDEKTRTFTVRAVVENPDKRLKPMMFADVTIYMEQGQDALAVPASAVQYDGTSNFVFVVTDRNSFKRREIVTGREGNGFVEVVSGLRVNEKIVSKGAFLLKSEAAKESFEAGHTH